MSDVRQFARKTDDLGFAGIPARRAVRIIGQIGSPTSGLRPTGSQNCKGMATGRYYTNISVDNTLPLNARMLMS